MNYLLLTPMADSGELSYLIMALVLFVLLFLYGRWRKSSLPSTMPIAVGDEVVTTQGGHGRVTKIDGERVTVDLAEGETEECALPDCVSVNVLLEHSTLLKLYERDETDYYLGIGEMSYSLPPRSAAAGVLKWIRETRLALKGVSLVLALAMADFMLNLEDIFSFLESGGRSFFDFDAMQDLLFPVLITLGTLVGVIMHLAGIGGMENLSESEDAKALAKVRHGFYWFLVAEVLDFIPLLGWLTVIFYIVGFVILIIGYSHLKNSVRQSGKARAGYSQAFTASILLMVGYIIPGVGAAITFVGYIVYYLAWKKIGGSSFTLRNGGSGTGGEKEDFGSPQAEVRREKSPEGKVAVMAHQFDEEKLNEVVNDAVAYNPQLVEACEQELDLRKKAVELRHKVEKKSDEELLKIIGDDASLYNPAMVYCCNEVLNERSRLREEEERKLKEEEEERLRKEMEEKAQEERDKEERELALKRAKNAKL